jgi:hypothetical protein
VSAPTLDRPDKRLPLGSVEWRPVVIGEWFCLSDDNPMTGRPFATSLSHELPPFVLDAVQEQLRITARRWNELVRRGEVYTVTGPRERFSLRAFLHQVRNRPEVAAVGPRTCEDCWGTLATHDYDASMTGNSRNVYLCSCTLDVLVVPKWG